LKLYANPVNDARELGVAFKNAIADGL